MILLSGGIKTLLFIGGIVILIYGICLGSGSKGKTKDNSRYYDKKEENPLIHAAKLGDPTYTPKGSGYYKDKNGKDHKEK